MVVGEGYVNFFFWGFATFSLKISSDNCITSITTFVFSLKETNQKLTEAAANAGDQSSTSQGPPLAEAEELIAQSAAKIEELETKVKELEKDKESSETKSKTTEETLSKYKDQTREILRKAKEKYTESITEKKAVEEKLKAAEEKVKTLEESGSASAASTSGAAEEAGLRTRALGRAIF